MFCPCASITDSTACSYIVALASNWRSFKTLERYISDSYSAKIGKAYSLRLRVGAGALVVVVGLGAGADAEVGTSRRWMAPEPGASAGDSVGAGDAGASPELSDATGVGAGCPDGREPFSVSGCAGGGIASAVLLVVSFAGTAVWSAGTGDCWSLVSALAAGEGLGVAASVEVELVDAAWLGVGWGAAVVATDVEPPCVSAALIDATRSAISLAMGTNFLTSSTGLP
jgi:hypothetical protein